MKMSEIERPATKILLFFPLYSILYNAKSRLQYGKQ